MNKIASLCATISLSMLVFAGTSSAVSNYHALAVDLNRDGLDFSGYVATGFFSDGAGETADLRWTTQNTDDAFMLVDATSLRLATGYDISSESGVPVNGNTLFRDGLRISNPSGTTTIITDGWEMLAALDSNNDGKLDASDPAWDHLRLFHDDDADGTIGGGELSLTRDILKEFFETGDIPTADQYGNRYDPGTFVLLDDSSGYMAGVQLQPVPEPGTFSLAALGLALLGGGRALRRRG